MICNMILYIKQNFKPDCCQRHTCSSCCYKKDTNLSITTYHDTAQSYNQSTTLPWHTRKLYTKVPPYHDMHKNVVYQSTTLPWHTQESCIPKYHPIMTCTRKLCTKALLYHALHKVICQSTIQPWHVQESYIPKHNCLSIHSIKL